MLRHRCLWLTGFYSARTGSSRRTGALVPGRLAVPILRSQLLARARPWEALWMGARGRPPLSCFSPGLGTAGLSCGLLCSLRVH